MNRRIDIPTLLGLVFALLAGPAIPNATAQENERIAAVVNDDIVSMRDLEERTKLAMVSSRLENTPEVRRRLVPQVLRKLIEEKLQLQEALRQGVTVTDGDIAKTVANIERQNGMPPGGLEAASKRDGLDYNAIMTQIKGEISWYKLLRSRYANTVKIPDAEIDAQLALAKSNMNRPQYLLSEIYLGTDNPSQAGEVAGLAERIVQQARQGAPFPALARQFSQTASAATGGDIGWIYEGQLPAELEAAVKGLQPMEVSNPVRTLTGYYILLLRDRRSGGGQSKDNTILDLAQIFLPLPANAKPADERIQTDVVKTSADAAENCDDLVKVAKELNSPQNPRPGKVAIGSLPDNLKAVLADLPAGKVSQPVRLPNGVSVFMVCSRKEDNGLPGREDIVQRLENERLDIQSRRLMRDLQRTAIVDIRI